MKKIFLILAISVFAVALFAQDFSDDDLFGGSSDLDLFDDADSFFFDDGIEELEDTSAKTDLSKGVLYETGSIKIGGSFTTSIGTSTVVYKDDDKSFVDHLSESVLTPTVSAFLSVDARPTQDLRMYTKFGLAYPFKSSAISTAQTTKFEIPYPEPTEFYNTTVTTTIADYLKLKELFTDFSIADTAFFRFGLHTVTWGTGYFFSPVSDMINTSSINPEDVTAQVDGSLNLRTQITFPNTQNCLWLYVIPSTDFINAGSAASYTKQTAFAGKTDLVFGNWEFGLGGYWRWEDSPRAMVTASGSFKKLNLFGEAVYSYGAASEWASNKEYKDKTSIFQGTIGGTYYWKDPSIMFAAQYYYDGNDKDLIHKYMTYGHNIAGVVNFGKLFGNSDVTATVFTMMNFGKEEIPAVLKPLLETYGIASYLTGATFSAIVSYTPIKAITISAGPYMTFTKFSEPPVVSAKFDFKLGGGKF